MVNLQKNIQWWWSGGSKTIEKPSLAMVSWEKNITIASFEKNYHRWSLVAITRFFGHYFLKTDIILLNKDIIHVIFGDIICPTSKSQGWEVFLCSMQKYFFAACRSISLHPAEVFLCVAQNYLYLGLKHYISLQWHSITWHYLRLGTMCQIVQRRFVT